jgi:acetate kinase
MPDAPNKTPTIHNGQLSNRYTPPPRAQSMPRHTTALAVLGGVDAIVFGGGVGEHSPEIRARILAPLGYAGIRVDESRNRAATAGLHDIGAASSAVRIFSMAVDEGRQLAIEASRLVGDGTSACGGS